MTRHVRVSREKAVMRAVNGARSSSPDRSRGPRWCCSRSRRTRLRLDMPLPSDAARVSLLAESSEDESSDVHEISAPGRMANPLAHAPDAELDALVRALRSKKPSDRAKLEAEEREAARARVRVELMSHVHRLKRDGVVLFPADFDAEAKAAAEARREDDALFDRSVRASMTDATRTASDERPFDPNGRSTRTETVSSSSAASRDASDADVDVSENLRDLDGSFERFRVSVDELANGPEPVTRTNEKREESEDDFIAETAEQSFAKLAAMDDALAAIQKDFAARVDRDVSLPDDDHDVDDGHVPPSTDTTHANEPFDEPFGGGDAEARLASVDARLKTFAARWES